MRDKSSSDAELIKVKFNAQNLSCKVPKVKFNAQQNKSFNLVQHFANSVSQIFLPYLLHDRPSLKPFYAEILTSTTILTCCRAFPACSSHDWLSLRNRASPSSRFDSQVLHTPDHHHHRDCDHCNIFLNVSNNTSKKGSNQFVLPPAGAGLTSNLSGYISWNQEITIPETESLYFLKQKTQISFGSRSREKKLFVKVGYFDPIFQLPPYWN